MTKGQRGHIEVALDIGGHAFTRMKKAVKKRRGLRVCKICKAKLSQYNQDFYCFIHQIKGQAIEDAKRDAIRKKIQDRYTKISNAIKKEKRDAKLGIQLSKNNRKKLKRVQRKGGKLRRKDAS